MKIKFTMCTCYFTNIKTNVVFTSDPNVQVHCVHQYCAVGFIAIVMLFSGNKVSLVYERLFIRPDNN